MKSIYISYANEDLDTANALQLELTRKDVSCVLVDHTDYNPSGDIAADMLENIKSTDVLVCIFTGNTNDSNLVGIELNAAVKREKKIYLFKTDEAVIDKKNKFIIANSVILKSKTVKSVAAELLLFLR